MNEKYPLKSRDLHWHKSDTEKIRDPNSVLQTEAKGIPGKDYLQQCPYS